MNVTIKTSEEQAKMRVAGRLAAEVLDMIAEHVVPGVTTEELDYSVVREYCGHGIGRVYHEDPQVLHYGEPGTGLELQAGMTFTIEPMVNAGKRHVRLLPDGWTVITKDHSLSAQWEHTVLVTDSGFDVLTLPANGAQQ